MIGRFAGRVNTRTLTPICSNESDVQVLRHDQQTLERLVALDGVGRVRERLQSTSDQPLAPPALAIRNDRGAVDIVSTMDDAARLVPPQSSLMTGCRRKHPAMRAEASGKPPLALLAAQRSAARDEGAPWRWWVYVRPGRNVLLAQRLEDWHQQCPGNKKSQQAHAC